MTSDELYSRIETLFEDFRAYHADFYRKGNKAAGGRARKSLGEIKRLVTEYRKASVEESAK